MKGYDCVSCLGLKGHMQTPRHGRPTANPETRIARSAKAGASATFLPELHLRTNADCCQDPDVKLSATVKIADRKVYVIKHKAPPESPNAQAQLTAETGEARSSRPTGAKRQAAGFDPRTAASISAMSIFFCFIIAAIALADTFLSAFNVNSVSRRGKTCHDTP